MEHLDAIDEHGNALGKSRHRPDSGQFFENVNKPPLTSLVAAITLLSELNA